jgi:outer membrane biosynthesis protein TonB
MRFHRAALLALLIAGAPALSGCADFDLDKLDVLGLNKKKPLPGERHALFPEGVPGVTQGVPPELMKGQAQSQPGAAVPLDNIAQQGAATEQPAAAPAEEKPKAKPKPKPKKVAARPQRIKMAPQEAQPEAASAQPAQAAPAQAAQQPAGGWTPPPNNTASPWPAPVPTGTFSKQQ